MSRLTQRLQRLVPEATIEDPGAHDERSLVVYGPPGTGKTTAMQRLVLDDLIQEDVDPQRIMVATFTRNARSQVLARLHHETALGDRSWPWVRTIHSACFRLLQLEQEQIISDADVREFGQACGYSFTGAERDGAPDGYPGLPSTKTYGDWALFAEDLRRACQLSIPEAVHALGRRRTPAAAHWSEVAARRFADEYHDFKRQSHLYDFTDLLEIVAAHRLKPPVDRVYIDEAQDLTHLQWTVVDHWASGASAVVAIGDDDQAIYAFAGADPQALMRRPGARAVLSQSWRLPANIHRTANQLVRRIHPRVEKTFRPIAEGGRLGRLYSWAGFPRDEGEHWLVLARNRIHLSGVRRYLRQRLIPFADRTSAAGIPDPRSPTGRAFKVAFDLHCDKLILGPRAISDLRARLYADLWPEAPAKCPPLLGLDDLLDLGAGPRLIVLLREDPLAAIRMGRENREYLRRLYTRGREFSPRARTSSIDERPFERCDEPTQHAPADRPFPEPLVTLATIHGYKGEEADHVVVATELTERTQWNYLSARDTEHRVFYVAATRARKTLLWARTKRTWHYEP